MNVEVERAARVRVRAQDTHGEELTVEAEGLPARVIQHEIDHLEGVLILDRISREARRDAMRALREAREADDAAAAKRAGARAEAGERAAAASRCRRARYCAPSSSAPPTSRQLC